jgi:branched-chain amino acid transport system permease protein
MNQFLQQLINGLSLGSIYALIALGYTMVYGVLRFINFAHGDVFMLGAYVGLYSGRYLSGKMQTGPSIVLAVSVLAISMVVCAIVGIVIERLAYAPLRSRPRLTVLITAIGVSLFLEYGGQPFFGAGPNNFPKILPTYEMHTGALSITSNQLVVLSVTIVLLIALIFCGEKIDLWANTGRRIAP